MIRLQAKPGTPVRVTNDDSMYRGHSGVIVENDPNRSVRLSTHERRCLTQGDILVQQDSGALFVVPASYLSVIKPPTGRPDLFPIGHAILELNYQDAFPTSAEVKKWRLELEEIEKQLGATEQGKK